MKSKLLRRILSVSLAAAMMAGVGAVSANVAVSPGFSAWAVGVGENASFGDYTYCVTPYGEDSYAISIVKYNGTDTNVVIPSSMKVSFNQLAQTLPVVYIDSKAFQDNTGLETVVIPNSVVSVGSYAFAGCSALNDVTIPDSVRDMGEYCFSECNSLESVTIPNSMNYVPAHGFFKCENLKTVELPSTIKSINAWAFMYCSSLENIEFPEGLTGIGYFTFCGCTALESIDLPDSVTILGGSAFQQCTGAKTLKIGTGITKIGNDFGSCTGLTSVTIPSSVTELDNAFAGCSKLESVTIPTSVTKIGGNSFSGCKELAAVKIPNSVKTIEGGAFSYCDALTSVTLPISVTSYDPGAFYFCKNLTAINVNANNRNYASVDGVVFNKDKTSMLQYPYAAGGSYTVPEGVTEIGTGAFINNDTLTEICLPSTLKTISEQAFCGCTGLSSVVVPDKTTAINDLAFANCSNLEEIVIPKSVTQINGEVFAQCPALVIYGKEGSYADEYAERMEIPFVAMEEDPYQGVFCRANWDQAYVYMYSAASDKTLSDMPSWPGAKMWRVSDDLFAFNYTPANPSDVRLIFSDGSSSYHNRFPADMMPGYDYVQGAVYSPAGLDSVIRPSERGTCGENVFYMLDNEGTLNVFGIGAMDDYTMPNGEAVSPFYEFHDKVKKVVISEGITHIGAYAFYSCPITDGVTLPSTLKSFGDYAFCSTSFKSIDIPDRVTDLGIGTFSENNQLTKVVIPESVTTINCAFYKCTKLATVILPETLTTIEESSFLCCTSLKNITIPESVATIGARALGYNFIVETHPGYQISRYETIDDFTIVGYSGSEAETYAENNGFTFEAADAVDELVNNSAISATSVMLGKGVTVSGAAQGVTEPYQFQYLYKLSTEDDWNTLKAYSTTTALRFTPDSAGTFNVRVNVKDSEGQMVSKDMTLTVKVPKVTNNSFVSETEITVGDTVEVTAAATGGSGSFEYEILFKSSDDDEFTTLKAYSADDTASFVPDKAGTYTVCVNAKDSAGQVASKNFTVTVNAARLVNNSTLSENTVFLGTAAEVRAAAEGGSGDYEFEILYKLSIDEDWSTLKQYGAESTAQFKATTAGTYNIIVNAKDSSGQVAEKELTLTVKSQALTNTSAVSAEEIILGETITISASAQGGAGGYLYKVTQKRTDLTAWTIVQDYSENSNINIKFAKLGTYDVVIKVKDASNKVVTKTVQVVVKDNKPKNESYAVVASIVKGYPVTVKAKATGSTGFFQYAVYYKRAESSTWTTRQGYSANSTVVLPLSKVGKYDVYVKIKDSANRVAKKTFSVEVVEPGTEFTNLSYISADKVKMGGALIATAMASGSTGFYQYSFSAKLSDDVDWTVKQAYSPENEYIFVPAEAGTYNLRISIKDNKGNEINKDFTVEVG